LFVPDGGLFVPDGGLFVPDGGESARGTATIGRLP
jgi:hypothetical protein